MPTERLLAAPFDRDQFAEFVASHGYGDPTPDAYALGEQLYTQGDDYATIGAEIVARGLTTDAET